MKEDQDDKQDAYSLLEEDWPCVLRSQLLPGCQGVALASSRRQAQEWVKKLGMDLAGSYVVVSPDRVAGIAEARRRPMMIPVEVTKANGSVAVADAHAYVVQLGSAAVWPYKQQQHLELKQWQPTSTVMGCQWVRRHMAADQWDALNGMQDQELREAAMAWLPGVADTATTDLFRIKRTKESIDALLRVPYANVQETLAKSGEDALFVWPLGFQQGQYTVIWLKQSNLERVQTQEVLAHHADAAGLVWRKDKFGIRSHVDKAQQIKTEMGLGAAAKFAVKGLPLDAGDGWSGYAP